MTNRSDASGWPICSTAATMSRSAAPPRPGAKRSTPFSRTGRNIVLLDVQLPDFSGIEVVRNVGPDSMPPTVFVTAYDRHAIEAFELAAVDYLLKPFDDERFTQALERARDEILLRRVRPRRGGLGRLVGIAAASPAPDATASGGERYLERITVDVRTQRRFIPVDHIEYITSDGPYARIHVDGQTHLIRERMSRLERRLDPARFHRIHRSAIVRLDLVDSMRIGQGGDYSVQLRDGTRLKVSRAKRDELVQRLKGGTG